MPFISSAFICFPKAFKRAIGFLGATSPLRYLRIKRIISSCFYKKVCVRIHLPSRCLLVFVFCLWQCLKKSSTRSMYSSSQEVNDFFSELIPQSSSSQHSANNSEFPSCFASRAILLLSQCQLVFVFCLWQRLWETSHPWCWWCRLHYASHRGKRFCLRVAGHGE